MLVSIVMLVSCVCLCLVCVCLVCECLVSPALCIVASVLCYAEEDKRVRNNRHLPVCP